MSLIDKYDEELMGDIAKLEQAIAEGEQLAGNQMRTYGSPEDVIRKAIQDGRKEGAPIHWEYGSSKHMLDLMEWLERTYPIYRVFPFRIEISRYSGLFDPFDCYVVFERSRHSINEKTLTLKESEALLRFMLEAMHVNSMGWEYARIATWYPPPTLMSFVANLIIKYNPDDLLKSFRKDDETSTTEWWETLKQQIVKGCNIPRLEYIIEQMHLQEVDVESVVANKDIGGLIKTLDYSIPQVKDRVIQALVEIGKPAVQPLILALNDDKSNVREAAAETLGRIEDPVSVEPLIQRLQDEDIGIRIVIGNALTKIGKPAVPALVRMLTDKNADVRKTAAETLGRMKDAESIESLVRLLKDDDFGVRCAAEHSLREFRELAIPPLLRALNSENGTLRKGAASVLGHTRDSKATVPVCRMLKSKDKGERISALEALEKIADRAAAEYIVALLKDKDNDIRRLSVNALGKIGDIGTLMPLVSVLKKDKDTRQYVWKAIADILGMDITKDSKELAESTVWEVVALLADDYAWSYASSILAVTNYPVTDSLIRALHSSKDRRIRKRIPQILAEKALRKTEHSNEILSVLCQALQDRDKEVKISSAFALEKLKDPGAIEALTRALGDEDVRFAAELALKKTQQNG
jgi:HEAT repeat protein